VASLARCGFPRYRPFGQSGFESMMIMRSMPRGTRWS
jgi:hypothetical protein